MSRNYSVWLSDIFVHVLKSYLLQMNQLKRITTETPRSHNIYINFFCGISHTTENVWAKNNENICGE